MPDSELMDQILINKINDFTAQNLANTAWAWKRSKRGLN